MLEFDRRLAIAAVIVLLLGFAGGTRYQDIKVQKDKKQQILLSSNSAKPGENEPQKAKEIKVYVTGAVKNPGVFTLPEGERVYRAVELAGGLTAEADAKNINMAAVLQDGRSYSIPVVGEIPSSGKEGAMNSTSGQDIKTNINTASGQELELLPGIGPALAERIVEYRQINGPFASVEDLKKVSGIGDKKFSALKDQICTK